MGPTLDGDYGAPENLRTVFDANPELRKDWQDAHAFRECFATPDDARNATVMLADLNRMDALFFSRRPEDHAELARSIARLDPDAFASLAKAMGAQAMTPLSSVGAQHAVPGADAWQRAANPAISSSEARANASSHAPARRDEQSQSIHRMA